MPASSSHSEPLFEADDSDLAAAQTQLECESEVASSNSGSPPEDTRQRKAFVALCLELWWYL